MLQLHLAMSWGLCRQGSTPLLMRQATSQASRSLSQARSQCSRSQDSIRGQASYSSILGSQQAAGLAQAPVSDIDVLAEQGGASAKQAGILHSAAMAESPAALAPGQGAAHDVRQQQQPGMWPSAAGRPNQISTPDNAAGIGTWQAITDSHQSGPSIQANAAATAAAAAAEAAKAGSATFPGLEAKTGVSFMREGDTAGGAGGFLGRDLFANQRTELSRHASPASMWGAPGPAPAGELTGLPETQFLHSNCIQDCISKHKVNMR